MHTPGPWKAVPWDMANAEFIVRACNSHEELLEACKALINAGDELDARLVSPYYKALEPLKQKYLQVRAQAFAAISRAEGKE